MMQRKFLKLKSLMYERSITQADIAKILEHGLTYVAFRMTGKKPFTPEEIDVIGHFLQIPENEIPEYFQDNESVPELSEHNQKRG